MVVSVPSTLTETQQLSYSMMVRKSRSSVLAMIKVVSTLLSLMPLPSISMVAILLSKKWLIVN